MFGIARAGAHHVKGSRTSGGNRNGNYSKGAEQGRHQDQMRRLSFCHIFKPSLLKG